MEPFTINIIDRAESVLIIPLTLCFIMAIIQTLFTVSRISLLLLIKGLFLYTYQVLCVFMLIKLRR